MKEYYLGVDLGGTKIAVCGSNNISEAAGIMRFPSDYTKDNIDIIEKLISSVDIYIKEKEKGVTPRAMGFGLKDAVDFTEGIWRSCPDDSGVKEVPFAKIISDRYGVPVFIDNDVHAGTLAEMKYGAGRKYDNFLYINVGTGVAVGAVIDGKLLRGACNYGGEAGHISVEPEGEYCSFCGQRGCVENIIGGQAIIRQGIVAAQKHPDSLLNTIYTQKGAIFSTDIFSAADSGDEQAILISNRVIKGLEVLSCGLINMFNPEAVIYGGGVMSDGWLFSRVRKRIAVSVIPTSYRAIKEFSISNLGSDHVGVLGAIALAQTEN